MYTGDLHGMVDCICLSMFVQFNVYSVPGRIQIHYDLELTNTHGTNTHDKDNVIVSPFIWVNW